MRLLESLMLYIKSSYFPNIIFAPGVFSAKWQYSRYALYAYVRYIIFEKALTVLYSFICCIFHDLICSNQIRLLAITSTYLPDYDN